MHLDRRFAIVVACSLVWGMIVALVFYRMAVGGGRGPVAEKTLVVAAQPLSPGASLTAESVKTVRVPESFFPKGGYSRTEDVVGRPVISSMQADEPLLDSRLAARGSGFGVAPMIPTGMRAVAVRVNDVAGVAGFVLPGMRVDVLVTGKPPGADDTLTATVLQNVVVLSAGQAVENDGKSQSMSVPVVTLLANPAQAESLTLAASEGHIQLVLRNSSDRQVAETPGRKLRDLYARGAPAPVAMAMVERTPRLPRAEPRVLAPALPVARTPAVAPAPVPPPRPTPEVERIILIHGHQKTVETFPAEAGTQESRK
jgi:pilus assembly protein CpaB